MLNRWQFILLMSIGAVALLLVIVNATLFLQNRSDQAALVQRQQFVQQSVQLGALQQDIVKSLAELAAGGNDRQVFDLLASHGFKVTANVPSAQVGGPVSPTK